MGGAVRAATAKEHDTHQALKIAQRYGHIVSPKTCFISGGSRVHEFDSSMFSRETPGDLLLYTNSKYLGTRVVATFGPNMVFRDMLSVVSIRVSRNVWKDNILTYSEEASLSVNPRTCYVATPSASKKMYKDAPERK